MGCTNLENCACYGPVYVPVLMELLVHFGCNLQDIMIRCVQKKEQLEILTCWQDFQLPVRT
jgi:hypothetical protein